MAVDKRPPLEGEIIGIDFGERKIGIARVHTAAKIPEVLPTIIGDKDTDSVDEILQLVLSHGAVAVVVGLPRGLDGQDTEQTKICRAFAVRLRERSSLPVFLIDEAGSTAEANMRIQDGAKGDEDSIAACVILETFLSEPNPFVHEVSAHE